jgi:membrane fusion protein, multidrug efflux system
MRPRTLLAMLGGLVGIVLLTLWIIGRAATVSTADARVAADMVAVSTDVAGQITALHVETGERVTTGQLLYSIDARDERQELLEYNADAARLRAEIAREEARIGLTSSRAETEIDASQAGQSSAAASVGAARSELRAAKREFDRIDGLLDRGLVTQTRFDEAENRLESARQSLRTAQAQRASANAEQRQAVLSSREVALIEHDLSVLKASLAGVRAQIERQRIAIDQHEIRSPIDGVVDEVFYDPGEHALAGFRVALLHNPDKVWIRANIKETEIRHVKPDAPVRVHVDSQPGAEVTGRVARIRDLTVSEAAMMANPNANGVFTKITQRIPVKIALDETDATLRPGTMVTVHIDKVDAGPSAEPTGPAEGGAP